MTIDHDRPREDVLLFSDNHASSFDCDLADRVRPGMRDSPTSGLVLFLSFTLVQEEDASYVSSHHKTNDDLSGVAIITAINSAIDRLFNNDLNLASDDTRGVLGDCTDSIDVQVVRNSPESHDLLSFIEGNRLLCV